MDGRDHLGPGLSTVAPDDSEALRLLFAEQRARLCAVRDNRIWQWFGGVPSGFGRPSAVVHGLYLQFAMLGLSAIALVVAGFTRGPALWVLAGLAVGCLLVRWLLVAPPTKRTLALYRRAVQVPGVVVAFEPEAKDPDNQELRCVAALVAFDVADAAGLTRLVGAGDRLRRYLESREAVPASLRTFVDRVRIDLAAKNHDGSRVVVPDGLGSDRFDLARLRISPSLLPEAALTSRLLFVFADPDRRDAGQTRTVQSSLWGEGAASLCAALPLEGGA